MSFFKKFRKKPKRKLSKLLPLGFHGDRYLLSLVDTISPKCEVFIETGTNLGSTLSYTAQTYPHIQCFSCEPDLRAFQNAQQNCLGLDNTNLFNETSQNFLKRLNNEYDHIFKQTVLFWLDAHGYGFKWPLQEEISFATTYFNSAYILIDDFKVPGLDNFGYDKYDDQECSLEFIQNALNRQKKYQLIYPAYKEKTSEFHPLRGWGLIYLGQNNLQFLKDKMGDNISQDNIVI